MSLDSIGLWEKSYQIQEDGRIWDASEVGAEILVNSSYSEFTSAKYLKELLLCLLDSTKCEEFTVRSIDNRGNHLKTWKTIDIDTIIQQFKVEVNWGVWAILSGKSNNVPQDLFQLLEILPKDGFVIHLDLDAGLLAALGPRVAR